MSETCRVLFQKEIWEISASNCSYYNNVQYSLPDDEHKMFETCRRQEELN